MIRRLARAVRRKLRQAHDFAIQTLLLGPNVVRIMQKLYYLREQVMTNQEKLDSIADQITTATTNIRQDIADLKAANPTIDFTKLENSVADLGNLDAENPPPSLTSKKK